MSANESFGPTDIRQRLTPETGDVEGHRLAGTDGQIGGENMRYRAIEDEAGPSPTRRALDDDDEGDPTIPGMRRLSNHRG
jgi:hypothetical protein